MYDPLQGNSLQSLNLVANVIASVRIHKADDQIHSTRFQLSRVFEHLVRFPDTWGVAKINFETASNVYMSHGYLLFT